MNIGGRRKRYLQSFQRRESPSVGLWHHEHHEDGVGGADAGEVDEEAPGAQQGHHSCCHLYLGAGWLMPMALLCVKVKIMAFGVDDYGFHSIEDAKKMDGHQG